MRADKGCQRAPLPRPSCSVQAHCHLSQSSRNRPGVPRRLSRTTGTCLRAIPKDTQSGGSPATQEPTSLSDQVGKIAATPKVHAITGGVPPKKLLPFQVLGLDATPELIAIFLVYFVQGILGLSRLAVSYYFKDELHLDPAELAIFTGFSSLPWLLKPAYGFLSDTFPIFGYRRRSYLVLCGLLGSLAWSGLWFMHPTAPWATALLLAGSAGTACSDVVVDSIVVEASRGKPTSVAGSYQSLSWGSAAIGGIISAYFSGSLIQQHGVSFVFGVTALFPLLVVGAALLISEARVPEPGVEKQQNGSGASAVQSELLTQVSALWGAIKRPSILYPAIFVFAWQATPSADSAMFYFYNDALEFGPEFLGRVRTAGSVASLVGIWLYNTKFKYIDLKTMFKWSALFGATLSMTQVILVTGLNQKLGISNEYFCLVDEIVLTVIGRVSFMPVLVLAAKLCPEGIEATLFATLMSILNGGSITGSFIGSGLTKAFGIGSASFENLALLVTICAVGSLLPLPLLQLVPDLEGESAEGGDEDSKSA